jgi:PPOX class probable F420-dependent enzyme
MLDPLPLDPHIRKLAEGPNFGVITTFGPDGRAQSQPIWVDADNEHLIVNTEVHRQKFRNIERDPRVTLTIIDEENPYHYAEVRGDVDEVLAGEEARDHIDDLSYKYTGHAYQSPIRSERVLVKISPVYQSASG